MFFSRILVAAFLLAVFSGCNSDSAYKYNQQLVAIENSLMADISKTEDLVAKYATSRAFDSIAMVSGDMADLIDSKLEEVKKIPAPDVKEGETFKKAYISYFEYLRSVYESYRDVGLEETEDGRVEKMDEMMKLVNKKSMVVAELQAIQKQFAKANNLKVE